MTPTNLSLVLVAALCHALWNLAAKRVRGEGFGFVWWYEMGSVVLWLPAAVVVFARDGWPWSWTLLFGPFVSAVMHIFYALSLQTGYDRADLGVVYPVARGVGPLVSMLVAVLVLGERPGPWGLLGGLVIIAGIVVVTAGAGSVRRDRAVAGLRWGGVTGVAIAAYTLWDNHSVTGLNIAPIPYFALTCLWQSLLMTPALRRQAPGGVAGVLRQWWREVAVVSALSPFAYILVLQAMRTTPVALVAPAREASIVVGALLGCWLFREPHPVRKVGGAVVVLAGIALIVA